MAGAKGDPNGGATFLGGRHSFFADHGRAYASLAICLSSVVVVCDVMYCG